MPETSRSSEALSKRLIELTRDLVLIPSTRDRPDEVARCMEFVVQHLELPEAITVRRFQEGGVPATVFLPHGIAAPAVMLLAHLDVVPRGEDSAYRSSVVDGRIYGPGSGDMKGELAILLEIFRAFHERYPGISLGMAVTSDEEIGGEHGTRFLFEKAGIRCGVAIVPDSGSLNEIAVEEKGILHLKIIARGSAGHASRPWLVDILWSGLSRRSTNFNLTSRASAAPSIGIRLAQSRCCKQKIVFRTGYLPAPKPFAIYGFLFRTPRKRCYRSQKDSWTVKWNQR